MNDIIAITVFGGMLCLTLAKECYYRGRSLDKAFIKFIGIIVLLSVGLIVLSWIVWGASGVQIFAWATSVLLFLILPVNISWIVYGDRK